MAEMARLHGTGELAQIERLARVEAVPANFLAQILLKLRDHKLITSRRGNHGGYSLARPPDEISLFDIMTAVEGRCLQLSGNFEGQSGKRLKKIWEEISAAFEEKLKSCTLDRIASKTPVEMYYI